MRLSRGQRRALLDLAVGKTLVWEGGRFFFREAAKVTIYSRTVNRLAELGLARILVGWVSITSAGVRKAKAMKVDPPRYYRKGTKPTPTRPAGQEPVVQNPLPEC